MYSAHRDHLARSIVVGAMAIAALAQTGASVAQQSGRSAFDHLRTTFPLTGVHAVTPCENCHVGGQMAGTPRQCEYCHRPGSRIATTFKPANHVQTNEACNTCHRSAATWAGARFSHTKVAPGTCMTCHTGFVAPGKPTNHLVTTASCDSCHRTVAWVPAGFNHAGVAPGTCMTCHNGSTATGKPSGHVATTASCDQCHKTTAWLPAGFNHAGVVPGSCETCHFPGGSGLAMPANHIPYKTALLAGSSLGCDACHTSTTTFTAEKMNHNNSQGNGSGMCTACHLRGTTYLGNMTRNSLNHSGTGTDCSQAGCHRPLGNTGSTYTRWN
jgi:Cytochrome c7 and related cytochrome c